MKHYDFMHLVAHPTLWQTPMALSIGVFDGLHIGHLAILTRMVALAHEHGWQTMAITFDRNPKMTMQTQPYRSRLLTEAQSRGIFENIGVDHLVVIDFSPDFSKLTAEEFLTFICSFCKVKAMVVGEDFRCGAPASCAGPVQLQEYLKRLAPTAILEVPPFVRTEDGAVASSTLVRQKLLEGALEEVRSMLGRPYALDLTPYSSKFTENGLLYRTGSFMQLLPPVGTYDADLLLSNGSVCPVSASFRPDALYIRLAGCSWDVETVRAKSLGIAKRSST